MRSSNESNEPLQSVVETKPTKKCTKCGEVKSTTEFSKDAASKDKLKCYCQECDREYKKQRYESMSTKQYKIDCMYTAAKKRAKNKGLEFTITREDIVIPEVCPCLGVPIHLKPYTREGKATCNPYSPSLDRIDNDKGYTPDNVWVVSHFANVIMSSATPKQLMLIAKALDAKLLSVEQEKQMSLNL